MWFILCTYKVIYSLQAIPPQAAHVSPQAPGLSAHPNPAHTFLAGFQQGAHPNAAHTALRPECARFQGAFPCAPGDEVCAMEFRTSG